MSDGWLGAGDRKRHIRRVRGSSPIHAAGAGGLKGNLSSEVDAGPSALRTPRITCCRTSMTHGIMQSRNNIGIRQTLSPMAVASRLSGTNSLRLRTRIFSSIYGRPVGAVVHRFFPGFLQPVGRHAYYSELMQDRLSVGTATRPMKLGCAR